jgi:hypothetical protein
LLDVNYFEKFQLWGLVTLETFGGKVENLSENSKIYQRFG